MQRKPAAAQPLLMATDAVTLLPDAERPFLPKAPLADGARSGGEAQEEQVEEEAKSVDPCEEASASEEQPLDPPKWTVIEHTTPSGRKYKMFVSPSGESFRSLKAAKANGYTEE